MHACNVCGWIYDESKSLPARGIAPGTKWEDLPEDFDCPLCTAEKRSLHERMNRKKPSPEEKAIS